MGRDGSLRSPQGRRRRTATDDATAAGETRANEPAVDETDQRRPRRGRQSDPELTRSVSFPTYWSRAERTRLGELANDWGMHVSAYIRLSALSKRMPPRRTPRPPVPPVNAQLYLQLAGVANNLNQLARRINTGGDEEPTAVEVLDTLDALIPIVRRIQQDLIGTAPPAERSE